MGLEAIHRFLTRYLRDETFREQVRSGNYTYSDRRGLEPADLDLIKGIELGDLDRAADRLRMERFGKRCSEFEQAVTHLGLYTDLQHFFAQYDRTYATGLLARPMEMERFLAFTTEWILAHGLPDYLIDLMRFCYHVTKMADSPPVFNELQMASLPEPHIRPFHYIAMRKPYEWVGFRYDVLDLARMEQPRADVANHVAPQATRLLLQKHFEMYKRAQVYYSHDVPLAEKLGDEPVSVLEMVSAAPTSMFARLVDMLQWLQASHVINVSVPFGVTD